LILERLSLTINSLRGNKSLLNDVKEQLFKLWGDLEERKSSALPRQAMKEESKPPTFSLDSLDSSPPFPSIGGQPDIDSDDDMEITKVSRSEIPKTNILKERDPNIPTTVNSVTTGLKAETKLAPKNKAFNCCIRQYGVKVDEEDPDKADAGSGKRWQRMFGLFGTQIL
jgi:protection-of-telomeres protein 1